MMDRMRRLSLPAVVLMLALVALAPASLFARQDTPTGSITVSDQAVVNNTITVSMATISQDGWIIVHKADADGKLLLTPPVGMAQIKAGDNANVVIQLNEPVAAGAPLWPMLHIDEGTMGTYEFPNGPDTPVTADGKPVMKMITVQAAAAAPTALPNTGAGDSAPLGLMLGFALALLAGGLLIARRRQA